MTDQELNSDAVHLCLAALKIQEERDRFDDDNKIICSISIENAANLRSLNIRSAVEIFYLYQETVFYLQREGVLEFTRYLVGPMSPPNPKGFYVVSFDFTATKKFVEERQNPSKNEATWKWFDEEAGIYQFGDKQFKQGGKIRKKVFQALMNIRQKNPEHLVSIESLSEMTGIKKDRLRIEIDAINSRLSDNGFEFHSNKSGYYYIVKSSKSS